MAKKKPLVVQLSVGIASPEGLVVLDSCGTCKYSLPTGSTGIYCNREGGYSDDMHHVEWQKWAERHRIMGNLWCPGFEHHDAVIKLVRKKLN